MEKQKEQKVMKNHFLKYSFYLCFIMILLHIMIGHRVFLSFFGWRNSMESLLDTFIFMITQLHYDDSLRININFRIKFKKFIFEIYFLSILKIEHILELWELRLIHYIIQ